MKPSLAVAVSIDEEALSRAYARSRATIKQLPIKTEDVVVPLERLLGTYEVVASATQHHDAALYVSAREARRTTGPPGSAERERTFPYPSRPGYIATGFNITQRTLAAYCDSVARTARQKLKGAPESIAVAGRSYTLNEAPVAAETPLMVGLDAEYATLRTALRQVFLYNPQTGINSDAGMFPESLLLTGPPGTGKSTLLRALVAEGERCALLSGTPFRFASYDSSGFSSYFGQSTKILKRLLAQTRARDGVGLFVIEDADMVLQSRDEQHKSHGILELQQYLMNELSGLRASRANTLTILTTNKPHAIDDAMRSRMQHMLTINPFVHRETHEAYWSRRAEHLTTAERKALAGRTHAEEFTGRDLDNILRAATARSVLEPTDDEIRAQSRTKTLEKPSRAVYEAVIAERITAQRMQVS